MNSLRRAVQKAWNSSLQDLDPARLVRAKLEAIGAFPRTILIATGKAAPAMAAGACSAFEGNLRGIVVTTDDTPLPPLPESLSLWRASHPLPDTRSVAAANASLHLAHTARDDSLLVLVSGGTSSLLCCPARISLHEKQGLTDRLLRSGASIQECNTVRRHLSGIKGGRLAAAFHGEVRCLIVSDVIGGDVHDIGSGPAVFDPTTVREAQTILVRYLGSFGERYISKLEESIKPNQTGADPTAFILAQPEDLARSFRSHLVETGWRMAEVLLMNATAEELSLALVRIGQDLEPGEGQLIVCEPTLKVPEGSGRGGRAGWVALRSLYSLPQDVALWAAASDGVDGNSVSSGAWVEGRMKELVDRTVVESCLWERNDAKVHEALGSSLPGGATGVNMTDVYGVFRMHQG